MKNLLAITLTFLLCLVSISGCSKSEDTSAMHSSSQSQFKGPFTAGIKWSITNEEKQCTYVDDLLKKENFTTTFSVTFQGEKLEHQCEITAVSNKLMDQEEFAPIIEKISKVNPKAIFSFTFKYTHNSK